MTDIFFSYSSKDRERVRPVRDALAAQGFDVFWDQTVPAGVDWDTWIRSALQRSKCAVVFWSQNSVASDNVRHEATVAKTQGKLVPVLIEELRADQFPMGLYSVQGANLAAWEPGAVSAEWDKLQAEVEAKLTPLWVSAKLHNAEAAIEAEKARRLSAESRIRALQEQIGKAAEAQGAAEQVRDAAQSEIERQKSRADAAEAANEKLLEMKVTRDASVAEEIAEAHRLRDRIRALERQIETSKDVRGKPVEQEGPGLALVQPPPVARGWAARASGPRNTLRGLASALVAVACAAWIVASERKTGPFRQGLGDGPIVTVLALSGSMIAAWLLYSGPWFARFPRWFKYIVGLLMIGLVGINLFFSIAFGVFDMR